MRRLVSSCLLAAAIVVVSASPAAASADSGLSSNWAGFAVHRALVGFQTVQGTWIQPGLSCKRGRSTYSSMWLGIGGYYSNPNALEQVGTDIDCRKNGTIASTPWWEIVPGPSRRIHGTVRPGDAMAARVTVTGNNVQLALADATRGWTFNQTSNVRTVDTSSADWILEAPSECISASACAILPLAHFRNAGFSSATAQTTTGVTGSIASPAWDRTRITLSPGGRRFVIYRGTGTPGGAAIPSKVSASGTSFSLTFKRVRTVRLFSPDVVNAPAYLRH